MALSFRVKDSYLFCEDEGIEFLKLKTRLTKYLGVGQIRIQRANSFALPIASAAMAVDIFREVIGSVPTELEKTVSLFFAHQEARKKAMEIVSKNQISNIDSAWIKTLDPAQAVAVSAMVTQQLLGLCLFDEQGIGKTVTTIAAFDILRQRKEVDGMIIVCPLTMKKGWQDEIEKFLPKKYRITMLEGSAETRRRMAQSPFDILICNFETVEPLLVLLSGLAQNRKMLLAVDESFNVKNKDATRSEAIRELRRFCSKAFVLCGTPAPNSSIDVIHQYDVADDGYTFAGFVDPREEESRKRLINERIEQRGTTVRRLKSDVLPDLPGKQFSVIAVQMENRQHALYEEARNKLELTLKSMDNSTFKKSLVTYFQQRSVLLQICSCPEAVDPSFAEESAKLLALDQLVQQVVEKDGKKLVVWSFYRKSLNQIFERYAHLGAVLLDGSSSALERAESVKRFQSDDSIRICVANPAAAGAGVTLHAASDAAYISFSNQAAHFLQSIDRTHRRGQKASSTQYHLFVCKGTIEEKEVQRLRRKEMTQHELLGDNVKWPNSLDEAILELTQANG